MKEQNIEQEIINEYDSQNSSNGEINFENEGD